MNLSEMLKMPLSEVGLQHYASPYYDPVKAHEYYMKNRELKGRKKATIVDDSSASSTSSTSSTAPSESSAKTNSKTDTTATTTSTKSSSSSYEEEYERYMFEANKKISLLQRRLGRLSKEARLLLQDEIYAEIDKLREENMNKKYELKAKYGKGGSGGNSYSDITSANYKAKYNS